MKRFVNTFILFYLTAIYLQAATYYVRPGASGNGSDWSKAYGVLPTSGIRGGDIIYVAGGVYSRGWGGATGSPGNPVLVKKATAPDHGNGTGWIATYAGVAEFRGVSFNLTGKSHITVDGGFEYGIKISQSPTAIYIGGGSHLTFKNMELKGPGYLGCNSDERGIRVSSSYPRVDHLTVSHCKIGEYDAVGIRLIDHSHFTVENSIIYNIKSGCSKVHHEQIALFGDIDNILIRNNIFYQDSRGGWAMSHAGCKGIIKIYNNVFYNFSTPIYVNSDGMGSGFQRGEIHNNTFVGYRTVTNMTPRVLTNNIYCNPMGMYDPSSTRYAPSDGTHNCYCYDSLYQYPGLIIPPKQEPFVNIEGKDFRLKAGSLPIGKGKDMGTAYAYDIDGTARPQGGGWDMGAYEYTTTNIEHRTPNVEFRMPGRPTQIGDKRIYNMMGQAVRPDGLDQTGIYLVPTEDSFKKIILVK